jgi:hypothetical protein
MEMQQNGLSEGAQRKALMEYVRALRMKGCTLEAHGIMQRVRWSALKQCGYSETKHGTDATRAFECFRCQKSE